MVETGTVKWFCNNRGFGCITPDNGDREIFFHHKNIIMDGYKTLKCFQQVTYVIENGENGRHAINVAPCAALQPPAKKSSSTTLTMGVTVTTSARKTASLIEIVPKIVPEKVARKNSDRCNPKGSLRE